VKLSGESSYLVWNGSDVPGRKPRARIVSPLPDVLKIWTPQTRISPLFGLTDLPARSPTDDTFQKTNYLDFIGPLRPYDILPCLALLATPCRAWLTLGAFNILVATDNIDDARRIRGWLRKRKLRRERWVITEGTVLKEDYWFPAVTRDGWRLKLASFQTPLEPEEFPHIVDEYRVLMASALSRSFAVLPKVAADLELVNEAVVPDVLSSSLDDPLTAIALLVDVNAALSRFASQAFSGSSPIRETECHFWTHSLLGSGVANVALWNIRRFLQATLGQARIPERVEAFSSIDRGFVNLGAVGSYADPAWKQNWINHDELPALLDPLFPQITYLSGRDGFRTTETTLSAPLSIVTSCNSLRWSLLTITHEVSHTIIGAVLGVILPDFRSHDEITKTLDTLNGQAATANLLQELRRFLLRIMFEMDQADGLPAPRRVTHEDLVDIVRRRKEEVEEIMVHTFDFIYFYGQKAEVYVPSIWLSWAAIPHLDPKLEQYVIRTVCATMANHFDFAPVEHARDQVLELLKTLSATTQPHSYVTTACRHLSEGWLPNIERKVTARMALVRIVTGFLQSPEMLQRVRGQSVQSRRTGGKVLAHTALHLTIDRIENPLRFIEEFTSDNCDVCTSIWMLHCLAFNIADESL
jgi:hypothetical protein